MNERWSQETRCGLGRQNQHVLIELTRIELEYISHGSLLGSDFVI